MRYRSAFLLERVLKHAGVRCAGCHCASKDAGPSDIRKYQRVSEDAAGVTADQQMTPEGFNTRSEYFPRMPY